MKNKILIFTLVSIFTIPHIVSAAWWNPTTWFDNEPKTEAPIPLDVAKEETIYDSSNIKQEVIEKEVFREIPVEKIVEKTKVVPDQSVIDENIKLKTEIKDLQNKLTQLQISNSKSDTRKQELVAEISNIDSAIIKILNFGIDCYQLLTSTKSLSCASGMKESERTNRALQLEGTKASLILELNKLGGAGLIKTPAIEVNPSAVTSSDNSQKQKEMDFFRSLIFNSDQSGNAYSKLCTEWISSYLVRLPSLDQVCAERGAVRDAG